MADNARGTEVDRLYISLGADFEQLVQAFADVQKASERGLDVSGATRKLERDMSRAENAAEKAADGADDMAGALKALNAVGVRSSEQLKEQRAELVKLKAAFSEDAQAVQALESRIRRLDEALETTGQKTAAVNAGTRRGAQVWFTLGDAIQDAQYGIRGWANNAAFGAEQLAEMRSQAGGTREMFSQLGASLMGAGGVVLALQALLVVAPLVAKAFEQNTKSAEDYEKALRDVVKVTGQLEGVEFSFDLETAEQDLETYRRVLAQAEADLEAFFDEARMGEGPDLNDQAVYDAFVAEKRLLRDRVAQAQAMVNQLEGAIENARLADKMKAELGGMGRYAEEELDRLAEEFRATKEQIETDLSTGFIDQEGYVSQMLGAQEAYYEGLRDLGQKTGDDFTASLQGAAANVKQLRAELEAMNAEDYHPDFGIDGFNIFDENVKPIEIPFQWDDSLPPPEGSLGWIDEQIAALQERQAWATDPAEVQAIERRIEAYQRERDALFGLTETLTLMDAVGQDVAASLGQGIGQFTSTLVGDLVSLNDEFESMRDVVASLGDMAKRVFQQMIAQLAAAAAKAAVLAVLFPSGSGGFLGAFKGQMGIPGFAEGGIVTRPTLAMIGEGGEAEAVIPMSKLNALMNSRRTTGGPVQVTGVLRGDGRSLSAVVRSVVQDEIRRGY